MTTLSMTNARQDFTELVNKVMFGGMRICISKNNKPAFALVPVEDLQTLEAAGQYRSQGLQEETWNLIRDKDVYRQVQTSSAEVH
jgi:prevent-host-death family protein